MRGDILKGFKLILVARTIGLDIIAYQVMPVILGAADRIEKRGNIPHIEVHFMAASSSKYYIYAANPS